MVNFNEIELLVSQQKEQLWAILLNPQISNKVGMN